VALRQFGSQTRQLERQQADAVEVEVLVEGGQLIPPPSDPHPLHVINVGNGSRRPIRNVTARIEPVPAANREWRNSPMHGDTLPPPAQVQGVPGLLNDSSIPLVRPAVTAKFVFPIEIGMCPDVRATVRFTDDVDYYERCVT
jgi:hypothetical protein